MFRRLLNIAHFQKVKQNLIENFGIRTPEILRNLKYSPKYLGFLNIMNWG